jgi:DNA-binding response OmpR family regulator
VDAEQRSPTLSFRHSMVTKVSSCSATEVKYVSCPLNLKVLRAEKQAVLWRTENEGIDT